MDSASFSKSFQKLMQYWNNRNAQERDFHLFRITLQLIGELLDSWTIAGRPPRPETLNSSEDRFLDIIHYMNNRCNEKITRDDLASMLHLHPNYFDRIFYRKFGKSPMKMLRDIRLKKALDFLSSTHLILEEIAQQCGFGDAPNFNKLFVKQYGQTPGKYRKQMKKSSEIYISDDEI
jgi:transcriptional regulator GlxA family with amidase domain